MIVFREATSDDAAAVLALSRRCFPSDDEEKKDPRFRDWEYRHGRSFLADDEGRVVAHLGMIAQKVVIDGASVPAVLAVDAMTDPDYRGRRLFSQVAAHARDAVRNELVLSTAWQIRKAVLGGIVAAGWSVTDGARVLIRPFALLSTLGKAAGESTTDVAHLATIARAMFDGAHVERSAEYLRWRYLESPSWRYDITATDNAWLVTRATTLKGFTTLAIVDVAWRPGASSEASGLLSRALRGARTTLAATLVTRSHPAYGWFLRRGFLPGPHRFNLLVQPFQTLPPLRWQLAWGDTDHL
jgi:N-acetylglutamate synthase-like GNAT family acetyltransferase